MIFKGVGIVSLHIHALKMFRVSVCGLSRLLQVLYSRKLLQKKKTAKLQFLANNCHLCVLLVFQHFFLFIEDGT